MKILPDILCRCGTHVKVLAGGERIGRGMKKECGVVKKPSPSPTLHCSITPVLHNGSTELSS